jgi:hypothetical protein
MAVQQEEARERIAASLLPACRKFEFAHWQRRVPSRYALQPLSAQGSVLDPIGGRFNVGRIDPERIPPFPALYLAEDQDTALQEALGGIESKKGLTFRDLALNRLDSYAMYSMSGQIGIALDIGDGSVLKPLAQIIGEFPVPSELVRWAQRLAQPTPGSINSVASIMQWTMLREWRRMPALAAVDAPSQQLGRMARAAGIEAIRYRSVKSGKPCLAVFPDNLAHSSSYVELDDPTPPEYPGLIRRLDSTSWPKLI